LGEILGGGDATEGSAGFDGLELIGIADQDDFGVGFFADRTNKGPTVNEAGG
jgi:hypothetical protein